MSFDGGVGWALRAAALQRQLAAMQGVLC